MTFRYEHIVGVSSGVQQIFVEQLLAVLIIPMGGADLKLLAVLCGVQRQWPWTCIPTGGAEVAWAACLSHLVTPARRGARPWRLRATPDELLTPCADLARCWLPC